MTEKVVELTPRKSKSVSTFVAGAIGGACEVLGTMPLDVIKTTMQVNQGKYRHPLHCGQAIVSLGGVRGLYAGMPAFLIQTAGKAAIRFTAYEHLKGRLTRLCGASGVDPTTFPMVVDLIAGLGAGVLEAFVWTTPTERLKVLRQTEVGQGFKYKSLRGGLITVLKEQGVPGLYVGAIPTALRQASSVGIRFMCYESVKRRIMTLQHRAVPTTSTTTSTTTPAWVALMAGGSVGALSVIINNPLDVIKSSVQSSNSPYKGTMDAMGGVLAQSGPLGFFQGLSARVPRVFLGQAITFSVYEKVLALLTEN